MALMTEELALVIFLMKEGAEVPEAIKNKALDHLKVISMSSDSDSARAYIIDRLIKALEGGDFEELENVVNMAVEVMDYGDLGDADDNEKIEVLDETHDYAQAAMDDFYEFIVDTEGLDERMAPVMMSKVMDSCGFVPLLMDPMNRLLVGFATEYKCIVCFGMQFEGTEKELSRMFEKIDDEVRYKLIKLVHKQWNIGDIHIHFGSISYRVNEDSIAEMVIRGF